MRARLITIPFSHYCEKARWAMDLCGIAYDEDGHLPLFHYLPTRRVGAGRTVPVVIGEDGSVFKDSTDIITWADAQRPGTLLPDGAERAEALALEDELDRQLGPATRRWAYYQLLPRKDLDHVITRGVPRWEALALRATRPIAISVLRRGLKIDAAGVERSRDKIEITLASIAERLRDGRPYLVGDRFTVADLTFAALASPILVPREHPFGLPQPEAFPPPPRAQIQAWRASVAGQHALRLYAAHRRHQEVTGPRSH